MKQYELECMDLKQIAKLTAEPLEENDYICETAGFVPLDVKFKQFEQNGMVAQFLASDFTSQDYRDMYLNPDFDISPDDDIEDVEEKRIALAAHIDAIKKKVLEREAKKKLADEKQAEKVEKKPEQKTQQTDDNKQS